jgi:putative oxidoreductase
MSFSIALLILRIVAGLLIAGHGSQKLFGWFGGHGLKGTTAWLQSQGFKPAWFWALLGALGEFGGGLLFALGLLTPLGVIGIFASMLMAVVRLHWSQGIWATQGGYEYPLVLLFTALAVGLAGPGTYSLDALIHFSLPLFVTAIGLVLAIITVFIGVFISRQQAPQQVPASS